jgi:predicted amidohydrolase
MESAVNIALAQMDVVPGGRETNLAQAWDLATQARASGADILLLPELWIDGYDLEHASKWASAIGEGAFVKMASLARTFSLYVAGSLFERHAGGISNTAVLYNPDGELLGRYRKVHLFRLMQEHVYLVPGDRATLCDTPWGPVGLAICYDLRFPELFRTMALAGAIIFLVPAQWPVARIEAWTLLARARAVENEVVVAACNRSGADGDVHFAGRSLVVDPWGQILAKGTDQVGTFLAQVDLSEIRKVRRYLPIYEDRYPGAYRISAAEEAK